MARRGLITRESVDLFASHSTFTRIPEWVWSNLPSALQWRDDLSHQLRLTVEPDEAATIARDAWVQAAR